ncbi:MAG TPA: hypothetical protein VK858_17990, partial [Longimicrobiales bacterium]|nr:hypothetical protein [Longimicrobiales bacterium]
MSLPGGLLRFHAIPRLDGGDHDGMHLLWSPPYPAGNALDGFTVLRRNSQGEFPRDCLALTPSTLEAARQLGHVRVGDATVWCRVTVLGSRDPVTTSGPPTFLTFTVNLGRTHSVVTVSGGPAIAVFAGLPDRTLLSGQLFTPPTVTLRGAGIGVVWIVTRGTESNFQVCGDIDRDRAWEGARVVVEGLQMPFPSVHPAVTDAASGRALAEARAQPDPLEGDFQEILRYADAALARPGGVPPWRVVSERPGGGGDEWDVSPFGLVVAPTILPAWHRALGFAHIDRDDLLPGVRYDYRLVGAIRRRDRDERMYDLHTVPRGYRLPRVFRWGPTFVWGEAPMVVEAVDGAPGDPGTIRKGIVSERLTLFLDDPTRRIVLDAVAGATIQAQGFRFGTSVGIVGATTSGRTSLDFGTEVDRVVVEGALKLMGIVPAPLDPALDPDEPVPITQTILEVPFLPSAPPPPPTAVTVTNLSDPARTAARGVLDTNRGFEITWDAPSTIPPAFAPILPADAVGASPTEVSRYSLVRSWAGRPFAPAAGDGTQVSGRNAPSPTDTPAWGFDLFRAFPPADEAPGSHADLVHAVEVFEPEVLEYGEDIVYRVRSVDATGRVSAPVDSPPVPLRKHVRPPAPTTPPGPTSPDPEAVPPTGVDVRLVQPDDPEATAADLALAAGGPVVRVRWGWGPAQRELDPDVVEFRVYEHDGPLTEISVRTTGPPTSVAGGWSLPVAFDRPVAADEFAGVMVVLGAAFRILAHPGGSAVALTLAPNAVNPSTSPNAGRFTVNRTTSAELNPEYWHRRVAVVPRVSPIPTDPHAVEAYEITLPAGWLAVDASTPRQREAIGVTAADGEDYVPDRRAAVESAPRVGNESTVAGAEVRARYYGRPDLTVA